jgi:hypothetical protein
LNERKDVNPNHSVCQKVKIFPSPVHDFSVTNDHSNDEEYEYEEEEHEEKDDYGDDNNNEYIEELRNNFCNIAVKLKHF